MKRTNQYFTVLAAAAIIICLLMLLAVAGCKKYLEVPPDRSRIESKALFEDDYACAAALNSIYAGMSYHGYFDGITGIGFLTGLYGDEFKNYSPLEILQAIYSNSVNSGIGFVTDSWSDMYSELYSVNAAIEGLTSATTLSYRNQWLGEAYFVRGLLYFYLTNLYGDVAIVLGTDYQQNNVLARSSQPDVYKQIITDLEQARSLLSAEYKDDKGLVTTSRGRPNRFAATALLARVHLYNKDWPAAAAMADSVVVNSDLQLVDPAQTFLINSSENIWGLIPFESFSFHVLDAFFFIPNGTRPQDAYKPITLSDSLVNAFEAHDLRFANWVGVDSVPASGGAPASVYYFPQKYKAVGYYSSPEETIVMLRLAEQYLIRAEALAMLGDVPDAIASLNIIRARAGLAPATSTTQAEVLAAVQTERRIEFFAEKGHRLFDLRRTGDLDSVMAKVSPEKGGSWSSFKAWWPIPQRDIDTNPNLTQTPGY